MPPPDETNRSDGPGGPSPAAGSLSVGDVLSGRYEIRSLLGRGGMGADYEVRDRELGIDLALKSLSPELLADERAERA